MVQFSFRLPRRACSGYRLRSRVGREVDENSDKDRMRHSFLHLPLVVLTASYSTIRPPTRRWTTTRSRSRWTDARSTLTPHTKFPSSMVNLFFFRHSPFKHSQVCTLSIDRVEPFDPRRDGTTSIRSYTPAKVFYHSRARSFRYQRSIPT